MTNSENIEVNFNEFEVTALLNCARLSGSAVDERKKKWGQKKLANAKQQEA